MATLQLDFAIIGVQKAGTTALAQYLAQLEQVFLPAAKETHYFRRGLNADGPSDRPIEHLRRHYQTARPDQLLGEATPIYLYWPYALDLLYQHNANMRLIVSLRHPVERVWSGWSMEVKRGNETLPFDVAIRDGRKRVSEAPHSVHLHFSYVERSFYARQIEILLNIFPRDQVFFLRNDQIRPNAPAMRDLQIFLNLNPSAFVDIEENVNPSSFSPALARPEDLGYLQDLLVDDIRRTAQLTGLDLADWETVPKFEITGSLPS